MKHLYISYDNKNKQTDPSDNIKAVYMPHIPTQRHI